MILKCIYCNVHVNVHNYSKCDAGRIGPHFGRICLYPLYRKQCSSKCHCSENQCRQVMSRSHIMCCVNTNMCFILENLLKFPVHCMFVCIINETVNIRKDETFRTLFNIRLQCWTILASNTRL